jgi:D-arabinose 1-dehydrogenase-like Zn-dependent alcohol dehydrogenase
MVVVGIPDKPIPLGAFALVSGRRSLAGSMIGSIAETQEMLDFSGEHNIVSDIEKIDFSYVNLSIRSSRQERRALPLRDRHRFTLKLAIT